MEYFDNYERALKSWNFIAGRVCNVDETGESRCVHSRNVVAQIGKNRLMIVAPPGSLGLVNSPQSS